MEHLLNFNNKLQRKNKDVLDIEKWTRNQKRNLHKNYVLIDNLAESKKHITLYKLIKPRTYILKFLLKTFQHNVNYQCRCKNTVYPCSTKELIQVPLFWISYSQIQKELKIKREIVASSMVLFNLLGLIYKLNDEQISEDVLAEGKRFQTIKKYKSHINYYYVPSYTNTLLSQMEKRAVKLKELHFGLKCATRQWVLRTLGAEYADILFPQYTIENSRGTTIRSDIKTKKLSQKILNEIECNGYIYQSAISRNPQWKISKHEILSTNNLICEYTNKILKKRFNLNKNGYIIYKKS